MEIKEIGIGTRLRMRALRERGMIEIAEDPKSGNYILIIGKGIRQKWYLKLIPEISALYAAQTLESNVARVNPP